MIVNFVPKEPDKAYVGNHLWLPKQHVNSEVVRTALEFALPTDQPGGTESKLQMWEESSTHLICPREFLPPASYPKYPFPFIDLRPEFAKVEFKDNVKLRDEEQERAWRPFAVHDNGILNLACGKGKTRLAMKKIAAHGTPTLVVVPDGGILSQWQETILGDWRKGMQPAIEFNGELGLVQGAVFDWAHPVTLALVTTLALRIKNGRLPEEFFRYFGLVVYDEVHQIGAPVFSLTAWPFYGDRIGLTATVKREDGLDPIYRYHIGEPFYSDLKQAIVPKLFFIKTPINIPLELAKVHGSVNISKLRSLLGRSWEGNVYRYWAIKQALDSGRKILALSHSKDQLKLMHAMFPGSALIVGDTEKSERMGILRQNQLTFAIAKLGSTGVDDDQLDTLFWLTPYRSRITMQQSLGRIQRPREGKQQPMAVFFDDNPTAPLRSLCNKMKGILKEWNYDFEVMQTQPYPTNLPHEVHEAYVREFNQLPELEWGRADDET